MHSLPRRRFIYLAWFVLHFGFIAAISCREIVGFVEHRLTILSGGLVEAVKKIEPLTSAATGESLASTNPVRRALFSYFVLTGIDCGYGYFANVPGRNKLVFELRYPDGKVEYALPGVHSKAAGLRVVSLLDEIGLAEWDRYRENLIKWRFHNRRGRLAMGIVMVRIGLHAAVVKQANVFGVLPAIPPCTIR